MLQHTRTHCNELQFSHNNTLQHAATYWNTLEHAATHCTTIRLSRSITLQCTATQCNTLHHTVTHCDSHCCTPQHIVALVQHLTTTQCHALQHSSSLQHIATRFNTLSRTVTHCNTLQRVCRRVFRRVFLKKKPLPVQIFLIYGDCDTIKNCLRKPAGNPSGAQQGQKPLRRRAPDCLMSESKDATNKTPTRVVPAQTQ